MVLLNKGWWNLDNRTKANVKDGGNMSWRDMSEHDKRDFIEVGVAWIIGAILLWCCVIIIEAVSAEPVALYDMPCRTVGHLEVPCE